MKRTISKESNSGFKEKLIVIEKIEAGLIDIKEGRTIGDDALKKRLRKWLK